MKGVFVFHSLRIGKVKNSGQHSVSDLVSGHWDMYNTFAELSGQRIITRWYFCFTGVIGKRGSKEHEFIYFEYPEKRGQIAIRIGDWKGVKVDMKTKKSWELYNLKNDPQETNNLAINILRYYKN